MAYKFHLIAADILLGQLLWPANVKSLKKNMHKSVYDDRISPMENRNGRYLAAATICFFK